MKKTISFIFCLFIMLFAFSINVDAICENDDLNEWATKIEVKFTEVTQDVTYEENGETKETSFAYILSLNEPRDDIKIIVKDQSGATAEAKKYKLGDKEIYGVGCYTNLEEETYIMSVYGANDKCNNELLRTLKYTVPRFNEFMKDVRCENSDEEICKSFTNSTKDMTDTDFNKKISPSTKSTSSKILDAIKEYGLFILVPLLIVNIFYFIKIKKYIQEERNR